MKESNALKKNSQAVAKAIVFDVGGVLYKEDMSAHYSGLAKKMGYSLEDFNRVRFKFVFDASRGKLKGDQYLRYIAKGLNVKDFSKFKSEWIRLRTKVTRLDRQVLSVIKRLKERYVVGTLSNILFVHHRIRLKKKAYAHFQFRILSCFVGARKPEKKIYLILIKRLARLGISPSETVFVDDLERNLVPARKLGMKTVLFKSAGQLARDLKRLGIVF